MGARPDAGAEAGFAADGRVTILELEVLRPGLVRVQGIWTAPGRAVVITRRRLYLVTPEPQPIIFEGRGAGSVLKWEGPISMAMFGLG